MQQSGEKQELTLTTEDRVIIVAYHLPLRVDRASSGNSIEWDDERGIDKHGMGLPMNVTYVGCIELDVPDIAEQEALEKLLFEQYNCIVIFLENKLRDKFYHRFCRLYLAPVMHNQMHVMEDVDPFQPDEWRAYCVVNQLFAAKVITPPRPSLPSALPFALPSTLLLTPLCPRALTSGNGGLLGRRDDLGARLPPDAHSVVHRASYTRPPLVRVSRYDASPYYASASSAPPWLV